MPSVLDNIEYDVLFNVDMIVTPFIILLLVNNFDAPLNKPDEPPKNRDDDAKAPPSSAATNPSIAPSPRKAINIYI